MDTLFTPGFGIAFGLVVLILAVRAFFLGASDTPSDKVGGIPSGGGTIPGPGRDDGTVTPPGQGPDAS